METTNSPLTLLVWDDGKLVGRVVTTENELASNYAANSNTGSEVTEDEHFVFQLKKDIRSKIKSFFFLNVDNDMQTSVEQVVTVNVSKNVHVHYKNQSFEFQIMYTDTRESFINRCISQYSFIDRNIVGVFHQSKENFTPLFGRSGYVDWEQVNVNDHISLAYGNEDKSLPNYLYGVESITLQWGNLHTDTLITGFSHGEVLASFVHRASLIFKRVKNIREFHLGFEILKLGDEMSFLGIPSDGKFLVNEIGDIAKLYWKPILHNFSSMSGGTTLSVDLSKPKIWQSRGNVVNELDWKCYRKGVNILATCNNPKCCSAGSIFPVCINLYFPQFLILTDSTQTFKCSACAHESINIKTFLVSGARAKFHFKKVRSDEKETFILEAPSNDLADYVQLDDSDMENEQTVEYDYIEITVVKFGMSFNKCQFCSESIPLENEKIMSCGRAFHKACLKRDKCPVCIAPELALGALPKLAAATLHGNINLTIPNQMYVNCSADGGNGGVRVPKMEAKPIGFFMKRLAACQLENSIDNEVSSLELQENFIIKNLPGLLHATKVNTTLVAKLRQLSILSREDEEILSSLLTPIEKSRELYKLVATRMSGITSLMVALEYTKQSGALQILSGYYTQKM